MWSDYVILLLQTLYPALEGMSLRGEHFRLHAPEPSLAMLNPDDEPHSCRGKVAKLSHAFLHTQAR